MSLLAWLLLADALLVALLMAADRVLQALQRPPGRVFDAVQLLAAVVGVFLHAVWSRGWAWAAAFSATTLIVPYLIEILGQATGFPFGRYRYTAKAGPMLPGGVPAAVVLMWWGLLYVTCQSGHLIAVAVGIQYGWFAVLIAALLVTAWDLTGDPVAVHAGMWRWEKRGGWYGIPWSNYAGWLGVSLVSLLLVEGLWGAPDVVLSESALQRFLRYVPPLLLGLLYLNYAGAGFRRGLKGPGIVALVLGAGMLVFVGYGLFHI